MTSLSSVRPASARVRRRSTARRWSGVLVVGLALTAGCSTDADSDSGSATSSKSSDPSAAPDTREHLRVDGTTRDYLLHKPTKPGSGPRPLVVAFHGRGADPAEMRELTGLNEAAKARGMLVAYPEALRKTWGAGAAPSRLRPDPDADVRFTQALVDKLVRTERADPRRVYVVGFSNGGSMALRVAADRPKLVAGAVSVAGQLPTGRDEVRPTGPVPVMVVYGAKDPVRPVTGLAKPGPAPKGQEPIMATKSARSSVKAFATAGRTKPPVERPRKGYDRTVWRPGPGTVPAELLVVRDAGHTWPGTRVTPPEGFGPASKALDTTGTVLGFLTDQSPRPPHGAAKTQEHSDR
ncbi:alpha/beta hydrolase family esterase [Streptomyces alboflavus]|uniref:alpha/beta hydrolase family esterase n=1 Tax=Streptomyces alboflavus TaxID=67267 RepID=UPI0004BE6BE5|nr:PHB depolymerase family esterase [Streptomyces alboflavus]